MEQELGKTVQYQKFIYYNNMGLDLNGNKLNSTSIGPKGEVVKSIITDNLLVHLDAGNKNSYGGSGTTWTDLSGFGKHGTLNNSPSFNAIAGGALSFNASNTYISLGNLGTIGNFQTVEVWFYSTSVTNYLNVCDMNYNTYYPNQGNAGPRLEQSSVATFNSGWAWSGNTSNNSIYQGQSTAYTLYANNWYNAIYANNNGTVTAYLNGVAISSTSSPNGFITTYGDVNIGRGFSLAGNRYFGGYISIFRIYGRSLITSEVLQNYNAQKSRFGL